MDPRAVACPGIHRRFGLHELMEPGFAVCISGHRPEKLPTGAALRMMQSLLYREIETAMQDGAQTFYTGMARGADLWAADIILHFRRQYPAVKLVCVLPFSDRLSPGSGAERFHVHAVMQAADQVISLSEHFYKGCYRDRNAYMIRHSKRLIALIADIRSGTGQTVHMAERAGLEMRVLSLTEAMTQENPAHEYFSF